MKKKSDLKLSFIGLGEIGSPIAGHLVKNVGTLLVFNRTKQKAVDFCELNNTAVCCDTIKEAVTDADVIITCVGDDSDLSDLYLNVENGISKYIKKNVLIIDHTTASAEIEKKISKIITDKGGSFFDAPVSGGSIGASNASLAIMVGGDKERFDDAANIMGIYGSKVAYLGDVGAGQICKMVNQICIAGILQGLAEGLRLAEAYEIDANIIISAIDSGAAGSWQMNNRSNYMIEHNFPAGFTTKLMAKDIKIAIDAAGKKSLDIKMVKHVFRQYESLIDNNRGDEDFTNLIDSV